MNIFTNVWLHPKLTTRYVIEHKTVLFSMILVVVGFMASGILTFQDSNLYPDVPYFWILFVMLLAAPIFGTLLFFIAAGITYLCGKLLKGTGSFWEIVQAISLGYIPTIVICPLYIIWLIASPESLLVADYSNGFSILMAIVSFISGIWSFVITVGAVSEAHQF